jgi:peroxiredoxin Q/BCP
MPIKSSLSLFVLGLFSFGQAVAELKTGDAAPDFHLMDQSGQTHSLAQYRGQWLVLYFYPKNDTPGCTKEACEFRDDYTQLTDMGVVLLGVSTDNLQSHQAFAQKYSLPFPLLSDVDGEVAKHFGSLFQLGPIKLAKRHSFIIDPEGRIAHIYRDVTPKTHSDEVINQLKVLGVQSP